MNISRISIQQAMRAAFPAHEDRVAMFYQMQEYQLGWRDTLLNPTDEDPGKLIRPRLVLMACQAAGGTAEQALPLAAGIQLIHDFSLIHDDIEDNSDTRRGRPTVWKLWGLAQGINTGDGMFVVAHRAVHQLAEQGLPAALVLDVLRRFDDAILTICEGQFLDLSFEGNLNSTEDDYIAMIGRKTAALLGSAAELGALVGGADDATARAFHTFGMSLGVSFQMQDDVLGIWGAPEQTGKPAAADLYRRKVSLPVVHALRHDTSGELAAIYGQESLTDADVQRALALLDAADARSFTEEMATTHHHRAVAAIESIRGDAPTLAALGALAEGLLGRQK